MQVEFSASPYVYQVGIVNNGPSRDVWTCSTPSLSPCPSPLGEFPCILRKQFVFIRATNLKTGRLVKLRFLTQHNSVFRVPYLLILVTIHVFVNKIYVWSNVYVNICGVRI